jgi:cell division protein FtsQ
MSDPGGRHPDGEASGSSSAGDSAVSAGHAVLSDDTPTAGNPPPNQAGPRVGSRRRWRVALLALALAGIVAGGAWVLLGSRLLAVRSVVVTGTRLVPQSEVLAVAGIKPGTPLIRVNTARVAARVETIQQVQSARVTRSWPDRVVIAVRERTPALAVPAPGGGFDLVDPGGVIVQRAARRPHGLPVFLTTAVVSSLRGDPDVGAAAAVMAELPARLRVSVISVTAPSPDQVTLRLTHGVTVLWGGTDHAQQKAEELGLLLPTHASYYDVSAPGTAVTN